LYAFRQSEYQRSPLHRHLVVVIVRQARGGVRLRDVTPGTQATVGRQSGHVLDVLFSERAGDWISG